jgi:autotransporter-associated beta strand protein
MKIETTRPNHPGIDRFKLITLALALASTAHAALPVTITNPGFESPVTADGTFTASATGWSKVNFATEIGVFNVDTDDFTAEAPGGANIGYVYGGVVDAGLAQVLTANLLADATYNLSVKVGNSKSYAYDGYRVQLLAGGTVLNEDNNTLSPASDTFVTSTVNYVYDAGLHAGLVGQPLEIRLFGIGLSGGSVGETEFDDVQLTVTLGSPLAIAGGPYNVAYTGSLSLNGSSSQPSEGQALTTYEWDLNNDGDFNDNPVSGATPASITYATLQSTYGMVVGANTIRLRVTDDSSPTPKTNVTTGTVNLAVGPPANDNFANAIDLTGVGASQTGSVASGTQTGTDSISATLEPGEPSPGGTNNNSVWFKWTSPGDGEFTYGTSGSTNAGATEWDSVIGIYTGASLNALTPLGTTPKDTVLAESMTVPVTLGTTYYIQLTGYEGQGAANILLTWNATVNQANILTFGPGATVGTVVANAANIAWQVPFGSNLATLAPTFTLSPGATCTVDGNPVVSGATVDFSGGPKAYVVTSQDSSLVNTYTVTVTVAPPPTDGTWITDGNGNWSDTANWQDGILTQGTGSTAFLTKNITADRTITVDSARTIGNITFTDSTTSSHNLIIASTPATNTLTLDVISGAPVIDVTQTSRRLTISSPIAGSDGLTKNGPGWLFLSNATSNYSGATTINDGFVDFAAIPVANIGGGSGRNITVAANKIVRRNLLDNAFLNRLVETTNEIVVMTGTTSNSFDLSSSTGATLPAAFISNWAGNGAKCELSGTITPAAGAYRLGSLAQSGALGIRQECLLSGSNQLIVGGNRVVLVGAHTFTGDTTIRDGGRLGLAAFTGGTNSLGLQNSALDLGTPASTGTLFLEAGSTAGPITGSNLSSPTSLAQGTVSATLGGLKGSRNLPSNVIAVGNTGNNTSGTATNMITGFTLNPGTAVSCTYSGIIADFASGVPFAMAKTGDGTQEFAGSNSYTGTTTVSGGTLKISHANGLAFGGRVTTSTGATTINSGATLDLNGTTGINEPIVLNGDGVGGNGAIVSNAVSPAGVSNGIAALTVPATGTGSAYTTTAPTVTISGGGGAGATATALLGLTTASITSVTGGTGWAIGDTMRISNASGNGAIAQVTTVNAGAVTGLSIIRAGTGFTGTASMTIARLASAATANPTITWNNVNFTVGALQLTNAGSGYTSAPTVTFSAGTASDTDVTKTLSSVVLASSSTIGGSGDTTIAGAISESGGSQGLIKAGAGTLTLAGANTYTGSTSVNQGTLALVGGSQSSAITVASGASLGFTLGSPTTSTKSVDLTNGTVKITGAVNNVDDYKLMTATLGFTFTNLITQLHAPITDYELQLQNSGTELWLVYTGGASPGFADWQAANTTTGTLADDHDGDGVDNGTEYFLGGPNDTTGFTALPGVDNNAGTLSVTWTKDADYPGAYGTDYVVETSATLAEGSWTAASTDASPNVPGTVHINGNDVTYTFPAGIKLFARLKVTGPTSP